MSVTDSRTEERTLRTFPATEQVKRRRGAELERAIFDAVFDQIDEVGYGRLTIGGRARKRSSSTRSRRACRPFPKCPRTPASARICWPCSAWCAPRSR
jgi:hypothetical protein